MNYVPTYPLPTIATQHAGIYRDDERSSPSSAGSAGSFDRGHKAYYDNPHAPMPNMPTTMARSPQVLQQQQQLPRNSPNPMITVEQPTSRRSRSRHRHRRSYEPHRHRYDSRSRSTDESLTRTPQGHRPTSPDRHSYDRSRPRRFSHSLSPTQNIPTGNGPPGGYSDPRTQPLTMPLQYTHLPQYGHRHQPSAPSRPIGYSSSRPQYLHRRSRSYNDMVSQPPRNAHPLPQQGYGHHSPMSTHQPHQIQTAAYPTPGYPPAGMGYGGGTVQPSNTSPTVMHPPAHSTTIVPLNDGKDGWVVVPAPGQSVSVMDPNRTKAPSTGSFFSRFLGKRSTKRKPVVPQQPTMMQPAQQVHPHRRIHRSRARRDSY